MNLAPTTIVLWPPAGVGTEHPPADPDPHIIRLHDLTAVSDFWTDTRVSMTGSASLLAGATMHAAATIAVSMAPRLNTRSTLAAAATVMLSTQAPLLVQHRLKAQSVLSVQTSAPLIIIPLLRGQPQITLSSITPRLTAAVRCKAQPRVTVSTNTPQLSRVAQYFAAQATIGVRSNSNLVLIGRGASDVLITFNGVETNAVRINTVVITDILNEAPNTATFVVNGTVPSFGTVVRIGLRDVSSNNLLFAGTVKASEEYYEGKPGNTAWQVTCEDFTFLFNRRRVIGTWKNVSATQVASDIVTRFTSTFSPSGIQGIGYGSALPPITVTFDGHTPMDALTQVANLVGGYAAGPDYNRVVYLFVTDPRPVPSPVTPGHPLLMMFPPVRATYDLTQVRTRVDVQGAGTAVGGPADFNIGPEFGQLPLEESKIFTPGTSGQVITEDAQILSYSDLAPGKQATVVRGNVSPPLTSPFATIATGVTGYIDGINYRWKIAFANALGETEVGPASTPPLTCPPFPAPPSDRPLAVGPSNAQVGPLVGRYSYACSFVTTLGETRIGPVATRDAQAVGPPVVQIGDPGRAGPLLGGQTYRYKTAYLTTYGESGPSGEGAYTPPSLNWPYLYNLVQYDFGGLKGNSTYIYGVSLVTKFGETTPWTTSLTTFQYAGWPGSPGFTGYFDAGGRMAWGQYGWCCSYYHDQFGETFLGPTIYNTPSGTVPPAGTTQRIGIALPGLSARAAGLRLYRGIAGGNPFQLEADWRRGNVPSSYLSYLSQGECGNTWPNHQLRGGGISVNLNVAPAQSPDVLARRLYRSKANGSELYLLAEFQHNNDVGYFDEAFDEALTVRSPILTTTGRAALVYLPSNPGIPSYTGFVGRRVYRTKANNIIYYRIADIKDMTSSSFVDDTPDTSLTTDGPAAPSTAGGEAVQVYSIPIGPAGTLGRRLYRTVGNGSDLRFLTEIGDNTTTTYLDVIPDTQLSTKLAPLTNTAGASAVQLTQIPIGGPSVTQRLVYRNKSNGLDYLFVAAIPNNTDTTYIDTKADDDLGRLPVTVSTIGALPGDVAVVVQSAAGWPSAGWFDADSQVVRYNGISFSPWGTGDTLTGIPPLLQITSLTRSGQTATANTVTPHGFKVGQRVVVLGAVQPEYTGTRTITALGGDDVFQYLVNGAPASPATVPTPPSGQPAQKLWTSAPGALTGAIAGGTTVLSMPMLTGVSGIGVPLPVGSSINLWVVSNSEAGQQQLAGFEGGDGVREYIVSDSTLDSVAACQARGQAELQLFQYYGLEISYTTRDRLTRSGALVTINLPDLGLNGSYRIQQVRIDQIDVAMRLYPRYSVTCSTTKYSLFDLLRHVVLKSA